MERVWLIVVILIVLWFAGYTLGIGGNWIHILFLAAILLTLLKLIRG